MAAPFESTFHTRALHAANRIYARVFHHVTVEGINTIPRDGPAMIIANHRSGIDPLLIQSLSARPIMWMMAKEYLRIKAFAGIFHGMRVIPVSRDGKDSTALRAAMRALSDGALLGVFPEGKIAISEKLWPFQTGAAMIAMRSKVPVIPIHHQGITLTESMLWPFIIPQQVSLSIGSPISLSERFTDRRELEVPTGVLEAAVQSLRPTTL